MSELRFSIKDDMGAVRIELAGSLAGMDVETVYQTWQRDTWDDPLKPVIVDITLLTEADEHGRALLVVMHRFGAQIVAKSPASSAIAQLCLTEPVSNRGWFSRLVRFFRDGRRRPVPFPLQAELICRY